MPATLRENEIGKRNMTVIEHEMKPRPDSGPRIDISEIFELNLWSRKFGVTPFELKEAVRKVGPSRNAVETYLNRLK